MSWRRAGITGVDTGMILVTDPCYVVRDPGQQEYRPYANWENLHAAMLESGAENDSSYQIKNEFGAEVGVVITNFGGDGVYPIYIDVDDNGQVLGAMIRFDGRVPR